MYIENDEEPDGEWEIEETGETLETAFDLFLLKRESFRNYFPL